MDLAKAMFERAYKHHQAGELDDAERLYTVLFNADPENALLMNLLGHIAIERKKSGLAVALFEKALAVDHGYRDAWLNLGNAHKVEHRNDLAKQAWEQALTLGESPELLGNFATLYADSGEPEEALKWADRALEGAPDHPQIRWTRTLALLSKANWAEGWREHESRFGLPNRHHRKIAPRWDGVSHVAGTLCLTGEQGLGDEIMFASCIPDVLGKADRLVMECTPRLVPLFERSFGISCYPDEGSVAESVAAQFAIGSLPMLYRNRAEDFPGKPYLKANPARVEHYRRRLEILGPRPWVGLSWMGGSRATRAHERSVPLKLLAALLQTQTVVSLQYGHGADEDAVKNGIPYWPEASGDLGRDYEETVALVAACDVVVTVCTALVHLSGALGTRCLVMTPRRSSWRYGLGDEMPWYKSVRLYRQPKAGQWEPVIERICADLRRVQSPAARAA